jgi:hypothetical protein
VLPRLENRKVSGREFELSSCLSRCRFPGQRLAPLFRSANQCGPAVCNRLTISSPRTARRSSRKCYAPGSPPQPEDKSVIKSGPDISEIHSNSIRAITSAGLSCLVDIGDMTAAVGIRTSYRSELIRRCKGWCYQIPNCKAFRRYLAKPPETVLVLDVSASSAFTPACLADTEPDEVLGPSGLPIRKAAA